MHPLASNAPLFISLFEQADMSRDDFAEAMGFSRKQTLKEMLNGERAVQDGHISDAMQILEDLALWKSILLVHEKNGIPLPCTAIFNSVLDHIEKGV